MGSLERKLQERRDYFAAFKEMALKQVKWRASRYNYIGFKNAIKQLRLSNPNLDTTRVYPNKVVAGRVIRDPEDDDPAVKIGKMPKNFGEKGYESGGDDDFPWFPNEVVPLPGGDNSGTENAPSSGEVAAQGVTEKEPTTENNAADDNSANAAGESAPASKGVEEAPSATTTVDASAAV